MSREIRYTNAFDDGNQANTDDRSIMVYVTNTNNEWRDTYASSQPNPSWRTSTSNINGTLSGTLSPSSILSLRTRDGVAILTCLLLLRLAFTPSDTAVSSRGLVTFADSDISATMELAFYSPFQSNVRGGWATTARPVPMDIDGDGIVEALVVPVLMKREEVVKEKELELLNLKKNFVSKNVDVKLDDATFYGWSLDGSWGLRILNLKPLHHRDADDKEGNLYGPFAPRTMFLSPLLANSTKRTLEDMGSGLDPFNSNDASNSDVYPIKLQTMQIPIQRTRLGEEEKSRQRHKKVEPIQSSAGYGTGSGPPPKDDPNHKDYDRTRHYFCGRDWHHASQSCHKHCPGGVSNECGEGETCYADTPCDVLLVHDMSAETKETVSNEETTVMALTTRGTLPGISTVWSDGSISLHVITADVSSTPSHGVNAKHEHRGKKERQPHKKPELELKQLWRVFPFGDASMNVALDFDELGMTFESGSIYGMSTPSIVNKDGIEEVEHSRIGEHGTILVGGRYTLSSSRQNSPKVSFHALDSLTGALLWDFSHRRHSKQKTDLPIPIIHTTSSARRRSHFPTPDTMDNALDNSNNFVEGEDVMTSEQCMNRFRKSVFDESNGVIPHEFWDGDSGIMSVGRFERAHRSVSKRRSYKKNGPLFGQINTGSFRNPPDGSSSQSSLGIKKQLIDPAVNSKGARNSWQSDLIHRTLPKRLINPERYNAHHPRMGKPNVVLFHGRDGVAVLSLKNGQPVCHISLLDNALYADMDRDGVIDVVQVVTSPEGVSHSGGIHSLIQRITKSETGVSGETDKIDGPLICHALVTSGLPPREEVFTAPLCLGGPLVSIDHRNPQSGFSAAPPLLMEGSYGYGNDVVFAMNNGVVVRYDSNGREVWRKKSAKDGTPSWHSSKVAVLGRIQFASIKSHSSVSASSHRNQHRPGSPVRPIMLSGEDGGCLISPLNGKVLSSIVYPQSVAAQPLLADLNGDGTDDLLVVTADAIWGYRVVVETGRSGFFSILVATLVVGVALAALTHRTSSTTSRRSMDFLKQSDS